eukprot:COSAG06_NODE_54550_length_294_cov_0.625641_1_plen_62_part_01
MSALGQATSRPGPCTYPQDGSRRCHRRARALAAGDFQSDFPLPLSVRRGKTKTPAIRLYSHG